MEVSQQILNGLGIYQSAQTVLLRAAKNLQVAHLLRGMQYQTNSGVDCVSVLIC